MVNVYKLTVMVIDHDGIGLGDVISVLKNTRYPNHCISPEVMASETRQIDWGDDSHPLNFRDKQGQAFKELFAATLDLDFKNQSSEYEYYEVPTVINIDPAGPVHSNQTGGCCCHHPSVNGYAHKLTLSDEDASKASPCICAWGSEEEGLRDIQAIFDKYRLPIKIDRSKPIEEAWIPVLITGKYGDVYEGIYTYSNCD